MSKILVTGGAGYFGSQLVTRLIKENYSVRILDLLLYKNILPREILNNVELIKGDIRNKSVLKKSLKNVDDVIHLASLVGDTICANHPQAAYEINTAATKNLAVLSSGKVNNFIYSSTCSVYGYNDQIADEKSSLNPVSLYAWTKVEAEKEIKKLNNSGLKTIVYRMSTLYGLSPRMRFDLVINKFCAQAYIDKKITLWAGSQWRPFIHIDDAVEAYIVALKNKNSQAKGEIYNLGSTNQSYKISKVAGMLNKVIPETIVISENNKLDNRSYRTNCQKIKKKLKFQCNKKIINGIQEITQYIKNKKNFNYKDTKYSNFCPRIKIYSLDTKWQKKYFTGLLD